MFKIRRVIGHYKMMIKSCFYRFTTGLEQVYEVNQFIRLYFYLKGVINCLLDAFDFPWHMGILELLGSDFELPISMDLYLERLN